MIHLSLMVHTMASWVVTLLHLSSSIPDLNQTVNTAVQLRKTQSRLLQNIHPSSHQRCRHDIRTEALNQLWRRLAVQRHLLVCGRVRPPAHSGHPRIYCGLLSSHTIWSCPQLRNLSPLVRSRRNDRVPTRVHRIHRAKCWFFREDVLGRGVNHVELGDGFRCTVRIVGLWCNHREAEHVRDGGVFEVGVAEQRPSKVAGFYGVFTVIVWWEKISRVR